MSSDHRILEMLSEDFIHDEHRERAKSGVDAERESRVKVFTFSQFDLLQVLLGKKRMIKDQFPNDARLITASYSWVSRGFEILVCSKEYDAMPEGSMINHCDRIKFVEI